ncbi:MAG: hypothetical protein HGA49_00095 [Eubacteriaceae bacterium]|nr:hypothetical protein [Eubacteriaceae bacterium]
MDEILLKNITGNAKKEQFENTFYGFYDPARQKKLSDALKKQGIDFEFFGGHDSCERKMLCIKGGFFSENQLVWPIKAVVLVGAEKLNHRDVMGAVTNTGIEREVFGDIAFTEKGCCIFVKDTFADYMCSNIDRIRNTKVNCEIYACSQIKPLQGEYGREVCTVSSLRLDNIVSKICRISRSDSSELIKKGLVKVDHIPMLKVSAELHEASIISVRGYGRFEFKEISGTTKKGNYKIEILKFL